MRLMDPSQEIGVEGLAQRFLNRELSQLEFNSRVLSMAEDDFSPLLERAKFLAIVAGNLDEFYMVRVAGLKSQVAADLKSLSPDGLTPQQQLDAISEETARLADRHAALFSQEILPALKKAGVEILHFQELSQNQRGELNRLFLEKIFPILTPLAVDPGHPFPYISNLSLNLAVLVRRPRGGQIHFARVKVPQLLPRFVGLSNDTVYVPLEDAIAANLEYLFPGMEIVDHHSFRVTRNADLMVNDDVADDLLLALEDELRKQRFAPAVRLEVEESMPQRTLDLLMRELQLREQDVHRLPAPLDLSELWELYGLDRPDLKDEPFQARNQPVLSSTDEATVDIFSVLDKQDVLVHHPYDSFTSSVQRFIEQAAADPNVLAIKQTVYRTSGESPIVDALIDAAEAGKQVVVLMEIKARFDERANIQWARALEQAGCHVVYGLVGLKTHCKLCLVVRQEGSGLRRYVHVGTGNYNPKTARLYEDMGLLSSDQELGADVSDLFNYLTGYSRHHRYRTLLVAPIGLREQMLERIQHEAEGSSPESPGRIIMKVNGLVDEALIDALYEASSAHVDIDLIVRGMCSLRPGVPGLSDTIRVRSILGRFLEHSRVFYFKNGGTGDIYIGSADMMHRNLDRRVEALVKVKDPALKERIKNILDLALSDNSSAWSLNHLGMWERLSPDDDEGVIDHQKELMNRAVLHD